MELHIAEAAVELIKELAETENLTLSDAFSAFSAESEMTAEQLSTVKGLLFEKVTLGEMAQESLTNALYSVFVTGKEEVAEAEEKETAEGTKYKVRVKERDSGSSYLRYATREKIAALRADPKIASVELTDYGDTGEDDDGQKTAKAKGGGDRSDDDVKEGLDPVDKKELKGDHKDREDKDIDNDGDVDDSDEYLHKRRKAVKKSIEGEEGKKEDAKESLWDRYKAIQEAKKAKKSEDCGCDHEDEKEVKEEAILEADLIDAGRENSSERSNKKLDGQGVDNKKAIKLMPKLGESAIIGEKAESKSQQRLFGMVRAAQKGEGATSAKVADLAKRMGKEDVLDFAKTKQKGLPDKVEEVVEPKVKLDDAGMPIMEYSRNNATGPTPDEVDPPKDPEGPQGVKNPKGLPKKPKGGDRRPGVGPGAGL